MRTRAWRRHQRERVIEKRLCILSLSYSNQKIRAQLKDDCFKCTGRLICLTVKNPWRYIKCAKNDPWIVPGRFAKWNLRCGCRCCRCTGGGYKAKGKRKIRTIELRREIADVWS